MNSAVFLTVLVVIFLVATSTHVSAECSVPFAIGSFGDCSARSTAMNHFKDSIDVLACRLFGDLDFNSTNLTNSWPNITDTCIQQLDLGIRAFLYRSTVRGPGPLLIAAQCQTYNQTMQCRMDCLLTFLFPSGSMNLFGYFHFRAISCDETLFNTSINAIFNNANRIQPTFTSRQSMTNASAAMSVSSSTITVSSPSLLPSPTTSTAVIQVVTQQTAQSTYSASSSIIPSPSPSSTQPTPASTPMNTQCTEETDALCLNNRDCGNSQFSTALTAACASDHTPVLTVRNSSVDSVLDCTASHQLFKQQSCNTMPKFRNVTCDCGDSCLSHIPPSSSSCSTSCILWFENITGSGSIFVIVRNVIPGENSLMELIEKTCNEGYAPPSDMLKPNCCSSSGFGTSQIIAAAAIGGGVLLGLLLILVLVCCCCCVKYKNRSAKAIITGDKRTTVHVAATNPSFGPTSPSSTLELGVMPPLPRQPVHPNPEVAKVIDEWKKVIRRVFSLHDIRIGEPIGEGAFGQVHQGQLIRKGSSEPHQVAIKTLKKAFSPEEVYDFISESAIMLDFDHPNVLQLLGVCFDTPDHLPLIVLPYMANGDLRSFLKNKRQQSTNNSIMPKGISINILLDMCLDIATGMEYLVNKKFVHRDLAARNCMVNEALEVKVADFGLSRDMYTKNYYRMESRKKLPIKWMAPECLNDTMYDEMTDVWSFGVTCWEIFTLGHTPYASVDNPDILEFIVERGRRLAKPPFSPKEIWVLMQQCWLIEPANRPKFTSLKESIRQICHHYRYQTVTHSASPIAHPVSPGCYAQPYLFPDQLQDTSEGESSDSSSSPSTVKVAAIPVAISGGDNRRLSSVSTISGEYNHLGHQNSSGSSGVHFMSSVEASATDTSFNGGDSKASQGITVTPERNEYSNVILRDPNTEPSYDDRGQSLADTGRHSITMPPAPHHYFMLDPDAVRAQRTYHTGTL